MHLHFHLVHLDVSRISQWCVANRDLKGEPFLLMALRVATDHTSLGRAPKRSRSSGLLLSFCLGVVLNVRGQACLFLLEVG